ncbi:hypothetical protein CVT25_005359 [Psilocybe cyanescens]|uniref:Uncharacterized protein n=1 Tax=Psilocybe cyanescens TaxID=93625 RepID=A0A409XS39_PSICY|nr:hypothetical protein CVT25_005359 [Psilocybe cyanescens]
MTATLTALLLQPAEVIHALHIIQLTRRARASFSPSVDEKVRLYAIFSKSRKILAYMVLFFVLSIVSGAVVMQTAFNLAKKDHAIRALLIPGGNFCSMNTIPRYLYAFWIPIFAFECFLCALAIKRAIMGFKLHGSYYSTGVRLLDILVRDSVIYFIASGGIYLGAMTIWIMDPVF